MCTVRLFIYLLFALRATRQLCLLRLITYMHIITQDCQGHSLRRSSLPSGRLTVSQAGCQNNDNMYFDNVYD